MAAAIGPHFHNTSTNYADGVRVAVTTNHEEGACGSKRESLFEPIFEK